MAVAKHFAQRGVWGVTPYAFSSSSSSVLWTALLALIFRVTGVHELLPLVLNLVFAVLGLVWIHARLLGRVSPFGAFVALAAVVVFPPLPVVMFGGMEHTLHILLTLCFLAAAADVLVDGSEPAAPAGLPARSGLPRALVILAALLPLARYEGLFVVFVVCVMMMLRRRVSAAVALGLAALAPIGLFGAVSMGRGWLPLPNTVLLKGVTPTMLETLTAIPVRLAATRPLAGLLVLATLPLAAAALRRGVIAERDRLMLWLFVWTSLLHLQLARVGWYYRYEAYLLVLGIVAVAPALFARTPAAPPRLAWPVLAGYRLAALVFAVACVTLRIPVLESVPTATGNIYEQQYQTGRFLASAYAGQSVTLSDIGAPNFLADLHLTDLMGLGDIEVARFRLAHGELTAAEADGLSRERGARIAVSYERWFFTADGVTRNGIPARWGEPVGRWAIRDCVVCGADTLAFFAFGPAERDTLSKHLRAFAPSLPAGVSQSGPYVSGPYVANEPEHR